MAVNKNEIAPGTIAYFEVARLDADGNVSKPAYPTTRDGPFVCVQAEQGHSAWSPLTTQFRKERLRLDRSEITGGSGIWGASDIYLNDGACTYTGPDESFVDASLFIDKYSAGSRPKGSSTLVESVLEAVRKRKGALIS